MITKFQEGIVWINDYQGNGISWYVPYKCKIYKEYCVHYDKQSKRYTVTHNNSGMAVYGHSLKRIVELMCIHFGDNAKILWDGKFRSRETLDEDIPQDFLNQGLRLRNEFLRSLGL